MNNRTPSPQSDISQSVAATSQPMPAVRLAGGYTAHLLRSPEAAERHLGEWEELCRTAVEPCLFFEPWKLVPAWRHLGDAQVRLLLLHSADGKLRGLFPLRSGQGYRRMPVTTVGIWRHLHCPLSVPLVHADAPQDTLRAFFEWLAVHERRPQILIMDNLSADGPFSRELATALERKPGRRIERESWERAVIRPHGDAEQYLEHALANKRRRELRRLLNRLSEKGTLEFVEMSAQDDLDAWLADFFALEQAGWKGRGGTAIIDREAERRYFEQIVRTARERGQFMMLAIRLDSRSIAMKCNFLADGGGYAAKIAYDETYAQYSPGVQLELHHIRLLHGRADIPWMDSCAVPGHFMKERLWTERRPMQSLAIGIGRWGNLALAALPALATIYHRLKGKDRRHTASPEN